MVLITLLAVNMVTLALTVTSCSADTRLNDATVQVKEDCSCSYSWDFQGNGSDQCDFANHNSLKFPYLVVVLYCEILTGLFSV